MTQENQTPEQSAPVQAAPVVRDFFFRADKTGKKRDTIRLNLAVPTVDGIAEIYNQGGKGVAKLRSFIEDALAEMARNILNENPNMTAANFPADAVNWEAFLALPEPEAAIRGIPKETWEAFQADYEAVMPGLLNKPIETVKLASTHLIKHRFANVKSDKKVISKLQEYLAIYAQSDNAENYADCIVFLDNKANELLKADSSALLENL